MFLEIGTLVLGLALLLIDLWTAQTRRRWLGYGAAVGLLLLFCYSFKLDSTTPQFAFNHTYVLDGLALFFKRFFLLAALMVLVMSTLVMLGKARTSWLSKPRRSGARKALM